MLFTAALDPPALTAAAEIVALEERETGLRPEIGPFFLTVLAVGPCSVLMTWSDPSKVLIIFFINAGDWYVEVSPLITSTGKQKDSQEKKKKRKKEKRE